MANEAQNKKDDKVEDAVVISNNELATTDGEAMSLPDVWLVDEEPGIKMFNLPRDYRAMVEKAKGWFEANGENKGNTIKGIILNARVEHGIKFGPAYPEPETVSQIVFVDEDNIVSTCVFRTSSHENFQQLLDNIKIGKKRLPMQEVTMKMEKKKTLAGFEFHLIEFSYAELKTERFKEVVTFVQANPTALNCFRDLPKAV